MCNSFKTPWVAILGADGAGKSSVIDGVIEHLAAHGLVVDYHHWCPKLNEKGEGDEVVINEDPHGQPARGQFMSIIKLFYLMMVWWFVFLGRIRVARKQGRLVLFDRYYKDLLADPRRYRFDGPVTATSLLFKFMPQPDLVLLLDADSDVLLSRKREVKPDVLEGVVKRYRELIKSTPNGVLIDASQPLDKVIDDVSRHMDALVRS